MNNELTHRSLALFLVLIFSVIRTNAQSCDGADGIFPPLSGNTVLANGDICANTAVVPYRWNITYTNVDDGGDPTQVEFFIDWDDGSTQTVTLGVGDNFLQNTGPNAYETTVTHMFPAAGPNVMCEYVPTVSLQVAGGLCPSTDQNPAPVVRWNTDDQNPGNLELSEQALGVVVYEICAGDTQTIHFVDRSEFNCVPANFPGFPQNERTRWFQFEYGIPVHSITGTGITIDTNTGSNPEGGGNVLLTTGNNYLSQVVERVQPINAPTEFTFDITVAADASAFEEFHITLNNWNECNPYQTGGIPTGIAPVQTTAIIRIIDSPPPPSDPSGQFCQFDPVDLTSTGGGGTINWYSDFGLTNLIHTGTTMDALTDPPPAFRVDNTVPGFTTYYTTETLGANNCEGPPTTITVEVVELPTTSNAGIDQTDCSPTAVLSGNVPGVGVGQWSVVSGPGNVVAGQEGLPNASVENLTTATPTVFRWTITNGPCTSTDDVQINRDPPPTVANAGVDISLCVAAVVTLNGNIPATGIGMWSKPNPFDPGTITDPFDPGTTVTGLVGGDMPTFRWTITSGTCGSTFDDVQVFNFLDPPADAGPDVDVCTPTAFLNAAAPPLGLGTWVITNPAVTTEVIVDPNDPNSQVTGLIAGTTYTVEWTVVNGACTDTDAMFLIRSLPPTVANAGADDAVCSDSYALNANNAASGIGTWTGPVGVTFSDPNDENAIASNLALGANALTWTIANSCGTTFDDVIITNDNPVTAAAGIDQEACGPATILAGNNPGGDTGTWSLIVDDGSGSIVSINDPLSSFSGSFGFMYTLQWEIDNGTCTTSDQVDIRFNQIPVANAGAGGNECDLDFNLAAVPSVGTGTWTLQSGPGTITSILPSANDPNAVVTVDTYGSYDFRWTEDNNGCTDFQDVSVDFNEQPVANAGSGGGECDLDFVFSAVPTVGIGTWTLVSGPGAVVSILPDANTPTATITVDTYGTYDFRWTENNSGCTDSQDITVNFYQQPVADAGIGGDECDLDFTLGATPSVGVGTWTQQSGPGSIVSILPNANTPNAVITVDAYGTYVFRWTEDNTGCTDFSEITVNFFEQPVADAGTGGTFCANNTNLSAVPSVGTGTWTYIPFDGSGSFSNPNDPNANFSGDYAKAYTLTWTEVNGICNDSDNIAILFDENPTISDAGVDLQVCATSTNLMGNIPTVGTGQWTFVSNPDGLGVIADPLLANSLVSGTAGVTYIFRWTITNGIVCAPSFDDVEVEFSASLPAISISGDATACVGDIKTYTIPGGNPASYNYLWDISGLPPSTTVIGGSGTPFQFITLEFFDPVTTGVLQVVTEDKVSLCTSSPEIFNIDVFQTPVMSLVSSDPDLEICEGESVTFTATDLLGIATDFTFQLNGSTVQSGPSNIYTTTTLTGINSVTVTGTAGGICPGTSAPPISHVVNPVPLTFTISGGGSYCAGGPGVVIGLSGSEPGITYELVLDGIPTGVTQSPGGGAFNFAPQTAPGTYTISGETVNNCVVQMPGSTSISIDPLPTAFQVTGGGSFCTGAGGLSVGLDGSEAGISYQLLRNSIPIGVQIPGSGLPLDFGAQTSAGTYEVNAINDLTGCEQLMNLQATIVIDPLPVSQAVNSNPEICSGEMTNILLDADIGGTLFTYTATASDPGVTGEQDNFTPVPIGSIINQQLFNNTSSTQTVTYELFPAGPAPTNCLGDIEIIIVDVAPLPEVLVTGSTTICLGESTPITFESSGAVPFTITYSDGVSNFTLTNVASTHVEEVQPDVSTDYEVISVTDANGCTTSNPSVFVSVAVAQVQADFSTEMALESCGPYEIEFRNDNVVAGVSYEWDWGDGSQTTISNEEFVSHIFENPSTTTSAYFNVTLFATNDALGCVDFTSTTIEVYPAIDVDISADTEVGCSPVTIQFDNDSRGVIDHRWYYREKGTADVIDERTTPFVTFVISNTSTQTKVYEVVYEASNSSCSEEVISEVTVLPELVGQFTVSDNPIEVTTTPHVTVTNNTLNKEAWVHRWDWGDGTTSDAVDPGSHTYMNKFGAPIYGNFEIAQEITFEDENGSCVSRATEVFNVVPVYPTVDFSAEVREGCRPLEVHFQNLSTAVDEETVLWEVSDASGQVVASSTVYEPVITLYDAGIYSVSLTGGNDLGIAETEIKEQYIEVFELPIAFFQVRPDKVFLPDGVVFTQNKSSTDADSYFWVFNMLDYFDGVGLEKDLTSTLYEPQVEYLVKGFKDIMLVVENSETGCADTSIVEKAVFVDEGGNARIPNAFTPNKFGPGAGRGTDGGGFNESFVPVIQGLSREPGSFHLTIYDRWGNLIFESWDEDFGWDGYDENGKLMPLGVYVYKLDLRFQDGTSGIRLGDVTLIR